MADTDETHGLHEAEQKLSEAKGRPFEVDKVLAQNRAKEERARTAEKKVRAKLEDTIRIAREKRHTLRALKVEHESGALEEKKLALEEAKRAFQRKEGDKGKK